MSKTANTPANKLLKTFKKVEKESGDAIQAKKTMLKATKYKGKRKPFRNKPLPKPVAKAIEIEPTDDAPLRTATKKSKQRQIKEITIENSSRNTTEFAEIIVKGSTGKTYKIVCPKSYVSCIPKQWSWNADRYKIAEMLADGVSIKTIILDPTVNINNGMTIYGYLEHPEFKEHIDGLVLETGFSSKRERIAGLRKVSEKLYDKIINELSSVHLGRDKYALNAVLVGMSNMMKQLAQEKEEFVEHSEVKNSISGNLGVATISMDKIFEQVTSEDKKHLEAEFDSMGDKIIKGITGASLYEDDVIDVEGGAVKEE